MEKKTKKIWLFGLIATCLFIILIGFIIWLSCRNNCLSLIKQNYGLILSKSLVYLQKFAIIMFFFITFKITQGIFIDRFLKRLMQNFYTLERYNSLQKVIKFILWAIFVFIVLSILIGNFTAIIASLGLIGFGLTFALQKPILNFVGWLTILLKNVYSEGDRIKIGNIVGDVKEIQLMNTILEGLLQNSDVPSGKIISFPNDMVLTTDVQNFTRDSNYILNELLISITYESNYHKAIQLLRDIITNQVTKNRQKYIKKIAKQKRELSYFIDKLLWSNKKSKPEENEEMIKAQVLEKQKKEIEQELKNLEEEFIPLIRIEMLDSSIQLVAQFKCPYNEIKKNRTEINIAFLDAIKKEGDIEIAYPHVQIVQQEKKTDYTK